MMAADTKMTIDLLMEKIGLPEEGQRTVRGFRLSEGKYKEWKKCFYEDVDHFLTMAEKEPDKEKLVLVLYLRFAVDLYEKFKEKGISDQIYYDTFLDFTIWYLECVKKHGSCGLEEKRWLSLSLKMEIYRLGRLQFQPGVLEEDEVCGELRWEKGSRVLHVHIPEGGAIDEASCDESFCQAIQFFGEEYEIFDCYSWILDPEILSLLSEKSNLYKFQKRFRICKVTYEFPQAEERVFGEVLEDKERYPENTSLQRILKKCVLQGQKFGLGYGIMPKEEIKKN